MKLYENVSLVDVSVVLPGSDEGDETEEEDAATDDGETEIVEHHGPLFHQVPDHHREQLGPQGAADDQRGAHLAGDADLLLRPEEAGGKDGGHAEPQDGGPEVEDQGGLAGPD